MYSASLCSLLDCLAILTYTYTTFFNIWPTTHSFATTDARSLWITLDNSLYSSVSARKTTTARDFFFDLREKVLGFKLKPRNPLSRTKIRPPLAGPDSAKIDRGYETRSNSRRNIPSRRGRVTILEAYVLGNLRLLLYNKLRQNRPGKVPNSYQYLVLISHPHTSDQQLAFLETSIRQDDLPDAFDRSRAKRRH